MTGEPEISAGSKQAWYSSPFIGGDEHASHHVVGCDVDSDDPHAHAAARPDLHLLVLGSPHALQLLEPEVSRHLLKTDQHSMQCGRGSTGRESRVVKAWRRMSGRKT